MSLAAQTKSDSLQDRIDALVREREDAEQSLEDVVLQVVVLILTCAFVPRPQLFRMSKLY